MNTGTKVVIGAGFVGAVILAVVVLTPGRADAAGQPSAAAADAAGSAERTAFANLFANGLLTINSFAGAVRSATPTGGSAKAQSTGAAVTDTAKADSQRDVTLSTPTSDAGMSGSITALFSGGYAG